MAETRVDTPAGPVSLLVNAPRTPSSVVVLGHGAGAGMTSDYMQFFAESLRDWGLGVVRFNFPYMEAGRKAPDRQPVLEQTFGEVVRHVAKRWPRAKKFIGGKSLGGRIASHVAAGGVDTHGLVFLGYPLHPPGRPDRVRDAHLRDIRAPMLFVEGTRDPFCPLATLDAVRKTLRAHTEVVVIDGGDHSLKVPKSSGRTTQDAWTQAAGAVAGWVARQN